MRSICVQNLPIQMTKGCFKCFLRDCGPVISTSVVQKAEEEVEEEVPARCEAAVKFTASPNAFKTVCLLRDL
ncbi:hypothetical protein TcWFU_009621 [Taenia crassiceps]|uniref:Uncharacterized protein n=1 Tax=Taenia crassiceps TaxID=6207 RepID=A0ABR4QMQ6_9CEST